MNVNVIKLRLISNERTQMSKKEYTQEQKDILEILMEISTDGVNEEVAGINEAMEKVIKYYKAKEKGSVKLGGCLFLG